MTSPRRNNPNNKDGNYNNPVMSVAMQLIETQAQMLQVLTQNLANHNTNNELPLEMLELLKSQSQLAQKMVHDVTHKTNHPKMDHVNNDFEEDVDTRH